MTVCALATHAAARCLVAAIAGNATMQVLRRRNMRYSNMSSGLVNLKAALQRQIVAFYVWH